MKKAPPAKSNKKSNKPTVAGLKKVVAVLEAENRRLRLELLQEAVDAAHPYADLSDEEFLAKFAATSEEIDLDADWAAVTHPLTGYVWEEKSAEQMLGDAHAAAEKKRADYQAWAKKYTTRK